MLSLRARVLLGYLDLFVVFGSALAVAILVMSHTQQRLTLLKEGYLPIAREAGGAEATPLGLQLKADQTAQALHSIRRTETEFISLKRKRLQKALGLVVTLEGEPYASDEEEDLTFIRTQLEATLGQLAAYEEVHTALVTAVERAEPAEGYVADLVGLKSHKLVRQDEAAGVSDAVEDHVAVEQRL